MSISELIQQLSQEPYCNKVKKLDLLIEALVDLEKLVEMTEAKTMVVSMIQYYLVIGQLSEMNNIDLRGPPGVGKTQLGCILAKIYNSLGILKRSDKPSSTASEGNSESQKQLQREKQKAYLYQLQLRDAKYQMHHISNLYSDIKDDLGRCTRWYNKSGHKLVEKLDEAMTEMEEIVNFEPKTKEKDEPIFTVTSRENFVAGYLGQTALKTLDLLEKNRGGVVFIDEAYSLYHGDRDMYGMEALTTLNKFISEHPDEIIIIFGGYKDLLEETIYRAQPGLKRRVMWTFQIDGYTPQGLSKIFQYQLQKEGWSLDASVNLQAFFEEHNREKLFPNYGGDTEKLALQCKIHYAKSKFLSGLQQPHDKIINTEHLRQSISHLRPKKELEDKLLMMYT